MRYEGAGLRIQAQIELAHRNRLAPACTADGLDDLRRQTEANILRHNLYFFDAGIAV